MSRSPTAPGAHTLSSAGVNPAPLAADGYVSRDRDSHGSHCIPGLPVRQPLLDAQRRQVQEAA